MMLSLPKSYAIGRLLILLMSASCLAPSASHPDPMNYPGATIIVGSGGGFAGTVREYRLLDSGHLFFKESTENGYRFLKKKSRKSTLPWFYGIERMGIRCIDFKQPGNRYQYVGLKDGEVEKKVVWGYGNTEGLPAGFTDFYARFMKYWVN